MDYRKTIDCGIWTEPDEQNRIRKIDMRTFQEVFDELKSRLEDAGLIPDEYFNMSSSIRDNEKMPDFNEAICHVNYGGSEGIYLNIILAYTDNNEKRTHFKDFATGKTLGETTADYYRMSLIAGECSILLNGNGCKIQDNTKSLLILDETETDIVTRSLELQAAFNNDVNRSNTEIYNLLQAVNPNALNKFLENEDNEELEV